MNDIRKTVQILILLGVLLGGCRKEAEVFEPEIEIPAPPTPPDSIVGFYLLNEGNMGSNKATLDYYDFATGAYRRNIYADANPSVPKELGDVGNDIRIYGSRLYAVINCSNKVEVMDAATARRIGQIDIPNCRYIRFHQGYAYVSSYAGPVEINPNYKQQGYVAKVDTATLEVVDRCLVGFQPDELEITQGKIFVANSGGYMMPNYESTVSVIDLQTFTETRRIEVARNLHRLRADRHGNLWVTSRGDYYAQPSRLYRIDLEHGEAVDSLDIAVSNFYLDGDSLYLYSVEWSYVTMSSVTTYGIVDVARREIVARNFITDGSDALIRIPYGILVHPDTKDIYLTDAGNYVSPGTLYCFSPNGRMQWTVRTGDIPAHFVFRYN
ncbi:MAG: YncE family protein [Tannerellaceae bacterium]|jgi:DNA-binding beta-propeller fold protein YncE|nr:YncE family protein [Tannerellaceae bacterium]